MTRVINKIQEMTEEVVKKAWEEGHEWMKNSQDYRDNVSPSKFFRYVWPALELVTPIPWQYLEVRRAIKSDDKTSTLEIGMGTWPFYKAYNKGEIVGVDIDMNILKTNRGLSNKFWGKDKNTPDYVVADYHMLPFRSNSFDRVVGVQAECDAESVRVLKRDGKAIMCSL